jgi:hypothetical protein
LQSYLFSNPFDMMAGSNMAEKDQPLLF